MEYTIHINGSPITLIHDNLDRTIDVDDLTTIDSSNLFGEHTTISAVVNRIGLLKAETESRMGEAKLDYKLYEGQYVAKLREEASKNGGKYNIRVGNEDIPVKLTETSLKTCFETDEKWLELKRNFIQAEKYFNQMDVLYWACQDKSRKLNGLCSSVTPEEYVQGLVEGKVNGILIKKK